METEMCPVGWVGAASHPAELARQEAPPEHQGPHVGGQVLGPALHRLPALLPALGSEAGRQTPSPILSIAQCMANEKATPGFVVAGFTYTVWVRTFHPAYVGAQRGVCDVV